MIGFVGLGRMGGAIVRRLLGQGIAVAAFDTDRAALGRAASLGAVAVGRVRDVADRAEILFACLPSAEASMAVAREAAGGARIETYAELSTIGRAAMAELAGIFRTTPIQLIDAPVIGNPADAEEGRLGLMLSGQPEVLGSIMEAASAFAGRFTLVGNEPGQAQLCRLVDGAIARTALLASCEAIAVGTAWGIDPGVLVEVIAAGTGRNTAVTGTIPRAILTHSDGHGMSFQASQHELALYLGEAAQSGLHEGVVTGAHSIWGQAGGTLGEAADISAVIRYFEGFTRVRVMGRG